MLSELLFFYLCRMQRNRGQFTSSKSKGEDAVSGVTCSETSPNNWGSVEGRPPSAAEYDSISLLFYLLIKIILQVPLTIIVLCATSLAPLFSFFFLSKLKECLNSCVMEIVKPPSLLLFRFYYFVIKIIFLFQMPALWNKCQVNTYDEAWA